MENTLNCSKIPSQFDEKSEIWKELIKKEIVIFDDDSMKYTINPEVIDFVPQSLGFENVAIKQQKSEVKSRSDINIESEIMREVLLPIPLIASNMSTVTNVDFCILLEKLGAMGVLHRAASDEDLENWTHKLSQHNKWVAVSVGVGDKQFDLSKKLIRQGANIIFIDIAHGYSNAVIEIGEKIKQFSRETKIVVGNTTHPGLFQETEHFASAVKVGIAQGAACETKNTAGVTEKQYSSIKKCSVVSKKYGLPMISDGGIREPADFVKAIGAGASGVMAGKIFAACPESAALLNENGEKIYAGMASRYVQEKWHGFVKNDAPEGGVRYLRLGESAENLVRRYAGSLKSGISYSGAQTIKDFQNKVQFVNIVNGRA